MPDLLTILDKLRKLGDLVPEPNFSSVQKSITAKNLRLNVPEKNEEYIIMAAEIFVTFMDGDIRIIDISVLEAEIVKCYPLGEAEEINQKLRNYLWRLLEDD